MIGVPVDAKKLPGGAPWVLAQNDGSATNRRTSRFPGAQTGTKIAYRRTGPTNSPWLRLVNEPEPVVCSRAARTW